MVGGVNYALFEQVQLIGCEIKEIKRTTTIPHKTSSD
jgi:hypothetical protein